jgi:hypothetical protein
VAAFATKQLSERVLIGSEAVRDMDLRRINSVYSLPIRGCLRVLIATVKVYMQYLHVLTGGTVAVVYRLQQSWAAVKSVA